MKHIITEVVCNSLGWCPLDHVLLVSDLIGKRRLDYVVEVGVFGGRSFIPLALSVSKIKGHIVGVDPFRKSDQLDYLIEQYPFFDFSRIENIVKDRIKQYALKDCARLITKDSVYVSQKLPTDIDLLHLNGHFGSFTAFNDARLYVKKVRKSGLYWFEHFSETDIKSIFREAKIKYEIVHRFDNLNFILERK